MADRLHILPRHRSVLEALLRAHLPDVEAWAYGSRVNGRSHDGSDLDLALRAPGLTKIPSEQLADFKDAVCESKIPFLVEARDWARLPERVRQEIERDHETLRSPTHARQCTNTLQWIEGSLKDACQAVDYGLTASASEAEIGPKFLRITDIVSDYIDWRAVPHVVPDGDLERYRLSHGDIVVARTGASTGASSFVKNPPPSVFASYLVRLRAAPGFDPRFLAYYLKGPRFRNYIRGVLGDKSAQPNASASTMVAAPLSAPKNIEEQRAIARILGVLDDKIELNRRMNSTLEAMVRALFKSWFVDFEPVRAKMEGRDTELPSHLAELFPDALGDQGLPTGWTSQRLDDLFDVSIGRTPPRKERQHFVPAGLGESWLSIRTMGRVQTFAAASEEDLTADAVERFRVPRVPAGTVMVSFKLTVGRVVIAAHDMYSNEAIAHLRARGDTPVTSPFTYCYMKGFDYHTLGSTSSIATAVNSKSIKAIEMVLPDAATHAAFDAFAQPVFDRILRLSREIEALTNMRDALLPRLISGEVRVQQAEDAVTTVL